jgi:hypothetical protein
MNNEIFLQRTGRPPRDGELFFDGDMLFVLRGSHPVGTWEKLGPSTEPGFEGLGKLQFELLEGVIIEGSPAWVLQMLLRAYYRLREPEAVQLADLVFRIFKECGWRGPTETDNEAVPGSVVCTFEDSTKEYKVDDIRPVLSQIQDPQFNGFLSVEQNEGRTTNFVQIGRATVVEVHRDDDRGARPDAPNTK